MRLSSLKQLCSRFRRDRSDCDVRSSSRLRWMGCGLAEREQTMDDRVALDGGMEIDLSALLPLLLLLLSLCCRVRRRRPGRSPVHCCACLRVCFCCCRAVCQTMAAEKRGRWVCRVAAPETRSRFSTSDRVPAQRREVAPRMQPHSEISGTHTQSAPRSAEVTVVGSCAALERRSPHRTRCRTTRWSGPCCTPKEGAGRIHTRAVRCSHHRHDCPQLS